MKTKRLAEEILTLYSTSFSQDFQQNKQILKDIVIIQSKTVRNQVACYITGLMKTELAS
jgi:small subunit ribosomal protein S17e